MYIQRALLLLILIVVIFLPSWVDWALQSPASWYRPHLLWLGTIIAVYIGQRKANRERS